MSTRLHLKSIIIVVVSLFIAFFTISSSVFACASCGSGVGPGSLYLSPLQNYQFLLGARYKEFGDRIEYNGDIKDNFNVEKSNYVDLAMGVRLSDEITFSLAGGLQSNASEKEEDAGLQDFVVSGRYSLYSQSIDNPYTPQVQILLNYKPKFNDGPFLTERRTSTDVFGSGDHQVGLGYDLWNGLHKLQLGFGQNFTYVFAEEQGEDYKVQLGPLLSTIASVAYNHTWVKLTIGYTNGLRFSRKINDEKIDESNSMTHSLFLTTDFKLSDQFVLRGSYNDTLTPGSFMTQKQTTVSLATIYSGI